MNKITNKELLTLNDLTNLQWQHVLLTNNESTESLDNKNSITYNLKQLLTPESFIREDKEGNFIGYPYMKTVKQKDSFSDEEKEKGLTEMRKNAPVVMNYLEECDKGSKEGDFLKDWEVIYGADSYDIITGYIDNLKEQLLKVNPLADMSSFEYPTREEILSQKRMTQLIEFSFGVFSKVMNVVVWYGVNPNKFMNGDVPKSLMENVKTAVFKDTQKPLFRSLGDATGSLPLSIIAHGSTRDTKKLLDNLKLFKTFGSRGFKNYKENVGKTMELDGIEEGYITISERFNYSNTDFKVVAFKKDNTIVIAYKNKVTNNKELLPKEVDYLNIVYSKIKRENPNAEIVFTGYEGGADLSFISGLNTDNKQELFYSSPLKSFKGLVEFTEKDLDKEYTGNISFKFSIEEDGLIKDIYNTSKNIIVSTFIIQSLLSETVEGTVKGIIKKTTASHLLTWVVVNTLSWLMKKTGTYLKDKKIEKNYETLIDYKVIEKEKDDIKGYVTDFFYESEYIQLETQEGDKIDVERDFALYYILELSKEKISKSPKGIDNYFASDNHYFIHYDIDGKGYNTDNLTIKTFKISKDSDGIFKLAGLCLFTQGVDERTGEKKIINSELISGSSVISSYSKMLSNLLYITGSIQRGYLKGKDHISFTYLNGDNVERSTGFPNKKMTDYKEKYVYSELNESIFLPFIGKDGEIQEEIRSEYVKNVFKDVIRFVSFSKVQKLNYSDINEGLVEIFKEYKNSLQDRIGTMDEKQNEKMAYFYDKVLEKLESDSIDYSSLYDFERTGYDTGILKFGEVEEEMKYGYNSATPLTREGFELKVEELKSYDGNLLKGSLERLIKLFNGESVDNKDSDYNFSVKDINKEKSKSTGLEKLSLEGKDLGTKITHIKKEKNQEDNSENKQEEKKEEIKEKAWFEKGNIEEYYENIEIGSDETLKVRYIYEKSKHELRIRFSKDNFLDTEIKVEEFKNGDFSIKLPRYHKLVGSFNGLKRNNNINSFNKDMKEVVNINDSVASKIVVDSSKLGNSLVKDGKVTDQGKTIFRFSKGDSEVYYYYHEDKRLEIFYGSLSKEISRFSNSIEITDFKNKDFSLLLPFGIAFVDFIEEEAKKNGKQIDNVTKISLLNYYDDKGSNARKTFLHDHTMLMLKDTSISAFNLSKELVPSNLKKRYNLAKGANIELELSNIWKEYRCAMEKCINEDLSHCRKKNYITKNTTTIPEDSEIDYLMAAYRIDKESFAFFKSFQRLTQVERDEKAEEEKRIAQEEKLKSTTKPKETVVAKDEGKPSLRNIGKNGSLGKLP